MIELVIVMVILGILAAIAAPQFVDMSANAQSKANQGQYMSVQSALSIKMADNAAAGISDPRPTLTQLSQSVTPNMIVMTTGLKASSTGPIIAYTFKDGNCSTATSATTDPVACVKQTP